MQQASAYHKTFVCSSQSPHIDLLQLHQEHRRTSVTKASMVALSTSVPTRRAALNSSASCTVVCRPHVQRQQRSGCHRSQVLCHRGAAHKSPAL